MMKNLKYISFFTLILAIAVFSCGEDDEKPATLQVQATIKNATAYNAANGAITLTINGITEPIYYFWSNGQTTKDISNLTAGTYSLKIVYGNFGVYNQDYVVGEGEASLLNLSFNVTKPTYFGASDGAVTLTVAGGTPPYTYAWSDSSKTNAITKLAAGNYSVKVTDASKPKPIVTTASVLVDDPAFVCGADSATDADKIKYPTVKIGNQCWMSQNLRVSRKPNGIDPISGVFYKDATYYKGANAAYGAHYSWTAAMNGATAASGTDLVQGICPKGFHLPTKKMWSELETWLSTAGNGGAGAWPAPKMRGTTSTSGFNALMNGSWGYALNDQKYGAFWTASDDGSDKGWYVGLEDGLNPSVVRGFILFSGYAPKSTGLSVRCVKD
jgi:uncharacterized protein (TIGR02145 family)